MKIYYKALEDSENIEKRIIEEYFNNQKPNNVVFNASYHLKRLIFYQNLFQQAPDGELKVKIAYSYVSCLASLEEYYMWHLVVNDLI